MFFAFLKIAWRNLVRERWFSVLNLAGLSTGLACVLLIWIWIRDERAVDRFNEKDNRLYQVLINVPGNNGIETGEQTPGLLAAELAKDLPGVEFTTAVIPVSSFDKQGILTAGEKHIATGAQFAGKDFFNVFSYQLIEGDKKKALATENSVVLSEKLALALFNTTVNITGRAVSWNQKDYSGNFIVTGVFKAPPANATAQFNLVFSYDLFLRKNPKLENWGNNDPSTYLVIREGINPLDLNRQIAGFIKSRKQDSKATLFVQRYGERYLYGRYENGLAVGGRIEYIRLFSLVALFILLIACINFMNLATAKATRRMKEIGIKKVLGAGRSSLILQFLTESILMSLFSVLLALLLVFVFLPSFNAINGKQVFFPVSPGFIAGVLGLAFLNGMVAGSYPAIYLSGFKPLRVLKGKLNSSGRQGLVRKGLVLFQFIISAIFIVSVLVVYQQMQLIRTKNLGYDRENILYFDKGGLVSDDPSDYKPGGPYEAGLDNFIEQIKNIPGVINAANFRHNITNRNGGTTDLSWEGKDAAANFNFTDLGVGYGFIETLGIRLKEGRSYSKAYGSEKSKIIFNEAAIEAMGIKDPVGKTVRLWGEDRQIIGVANNFNFQSLHESLKPCFFDLTVGERASNIMVRIGAKDQQQTLQRLGQFYKEQNLGIPLEFRFLDSDYQALYAAETRVALLSKYFAGFAILISCLGLLGLSAFTSQKRQKEIGIRKVVGATPVQMLLLLYRDFLPVVLVAMLTGFPLAYWFTSRWLTGFAYRVSLGIIPFLVAGSSILLLTLAAISFQSIRAARTNPAVSLRNE